MQLGKCDLVTLFLIELYDDSDDLRGSSIYMHEVDG